MAFSVASWAFATADQGLLRAEVLRHRDPVVSRDVAALALAAVVATTAEARDAGIALARRRLAAARSDLDRAA